MLTTEINIEHEILLERLFNEYCLLLYRKTYPLTDNNVFNYFLDFYSWRYKDQTDIMEKYFLNPIKKITKEEYSISDIYCIRNNRLWSDNIMKNYNEYLKNELKNVVT